MRKADGEPGGARRKTFDSADRATIIRMRGLRASWSRIAAAVGASEPDVRKTFDPDWTGSRR